MGLLTRLGEPILERLRALTTQSRMMAISLGLLIAVGLWLLGGRAAPHEFVALLDGRELTEPQIARIIAAFRKHRLEGARIAGRNVEIPAAQKDFYLMAVDAENAWPAKFDAPVERALASANPLMSWQQNRENLQRSEKQMLARIVAEMSGIENAAVQYDEVRHPGFPPRVESRAMVAVKAVGLRHLEPEEIEAIRDTVVAFKSGLQRENVTITDLNACRAYPGCRAPDTSHLSARTLAAAKRAFEDQWQAKIEERLHMYPDLTIAVHAHFTEATGTGQRLVPDPASVMQLAQVTASIDVPKSHFVHVWRQRHGHLGHDAPRAEQIQEIEDEVCSTIARAVSAMLPPPARGWQTSGRVLVTSRDDLSAEPVPASRSPRLMLGIGTSVIASLVAASAVLAVLLVFLRQAARRKANSERDATDLLTRAPDRPVLALFGAASAPSPAELQRQLAKLVQQDPAAVAEALKSWLNRPKNQAMVDSSMTLQDEFLRKAAVLIGTLDDQATESLLELLGRERTVHLRKMLTELSPVTLDERSQIIHEFLQTSHAQAACLQDAEGVELDDSLAAKIAAPADIGPTDGLPDAPAPQPIGAEASPFSFLLPEDPRVLGDLLAAEGAPTISVVLSYLPSVKTAELLQQLPAPLRRDVLECLGGLQRTREPDTVQLAAQLRTALQRRLREPPRPKAADAAARTVAARETPVAFEFDDLNALADHALAMVFQRAEPRVALIALTGASPSLFDRIQRQLPWRESRELRNQIERLGPIRLSDVEHAQLKLAETAAALIREKSISPPKDRRFTTAA